ncbi:MAG TPA: type II toxin-antitoxin system RelE/ParE family toxin [Herpetosiphonaceae bacterium]|nr:type II toxin-antitoxin system RelE/ParE family toxin [Herpetosiphonaceae bacterium]
MPPRYRLQILPRAEKELAKLPAQERHRIYPAIRDLADNPRPHGCTKLRGREGWRIRVGAYRIIYTISDDVLVVTIEQVGHRRDIYE